ncbi:aldo keto reductase [Paucilactobacillus oligofermentans DSM 15707 = LMG 22743]|uniref:Aldo keto reductase n=1 Tax=Paucilactobacillus oligofermentans DSM 15707 = LMG 22743 TaxID=1423778 RepID=A0A0R1RHZ0_9LACO|nr:aldo/keto reductase [Paucilactobacillus oligofermentans]KRL54852.1 aldo keto reductase [Paucilactobacillus oligofermentans DSM 15707 = LMG 22743]CUS26233.1 2,5-didehydrogluconate reductase [Paucilactobacillus oligofermentans DSM 15707 = LMG 22743]
MENSIKLSDGSLIPRVGFGTYLLNGYTGVNAISSALNNGYRFLDSAFNYDNEAVVGEAIRRSDVSRDEITVLSKLPGRFHKYEQAIQAIQESVLRTGLDYIDLYLIHWPNPNQKLYVEAWQALIDAQKFGLVKSIGVSNFLPEHLEKLELETGILPVVNEIELQPYFNNSDLRNYNASKGIITIDWSPLGRANEMLKDQTIGTIAAAHNKTIAQVILRWELQLDTITVPKATSQSRQLENLNVFDFELTPAEMQTINTLTRADGRTSNQDPAVHEEF